RGSKVQPGGRANGGGRRYRLEQGSATPRRRPLRLGRQPRGQPLQRRRPARLALPHGRLAGADRRQELGEVKSKKAKGRSEDAGQQHGSRLQLLPFAFLLFTSYVVADLRLRSWSAMTP